MKYLYRVSFFKKLADSTGHCVDALQGAVEVEGDRKSRVIGNARRKFAELKDVPVWSLRADYERVVMLGHSRREPRKVFLGMGNLDYLLGLN